MPNIALLLLLILLTGCASNQTLKLWNASTVANTPSSVALLKGPAGEKIDTGIPVVDIQQMIAVKERVESVAGTLRTGLFIAEGHEPNAFSFASTHGPVIAINFGMLRLVQRDDDALAALIGHELSHLYLKHGQSRRERENKRIATSIALSFAFGMFGAPIPFEATDAATSAVSSKFSRDEEHEADQLGLEMMSKAGFDPAGGVRLQEKLAAATQNESVSFLSSHPASDERIQRMKKLAQELRAKQGLTKAQPVWR